MLLVGLTGNFGMGKSFVLSVFRGLGAVTLDSDRIVGILLREEKVIEAVRGLLGDNVLDADRKLNKKAVAERIFNDPEARKALEGIIHPMVFARVDDFVCKLRGKDLIVIVEVPLLFERDYQDRFNKVITVYTNEETAIKRLVNSGFTKEEAIARLMTQLPIDIKKQRAHYTIDNSATKDETERQVRSIYNMLMENAGTGPDKNDCEGAA
jgi:dephospho-CoA kinase